MCIRDSTNAQVKETLVFISINNNNYYKSLSPYWSSTHMGWHCSFEDTIMLWKKLINGTFHEFLSSLSVQAVGKLCLRWQNPAILCKTWYDFFFRFILWFDTESQHQRVKVCCCTEPHWTTLKLYPYSCLAFEWIYFLSVDSKQGHLQPQCHSKARHLSEQNSFCSFNRLRTFALIVSAHPCCARNS